MQLLFPIWRRIQLDFIQYIVFHNTQYYTVYLPQRCKINTKYMDDVPYIYRRHDVPYSIITFYKLNNIVYFKAFPNTSKFVLYDIK